MRFRAGRSTGGWVGVLLLAALLSVIGAIVATMRSVGPGELSAILLLALVALTPVLIWLAYWLWGYVSLSYTLSRDSVDIRWAASRQVVPMGVITHVLAGREYGEPLSGFHWPGHEVGRTKLQLDDGSIRDALVYSTAPPSGQLLLVTRHLAYAISPANRSEFVEEFKVRRRLGTVQQLDQETIQPRWARMSLWADWLALRMVAIAIALNALAFAWLLWHYPSLPEQVALQHTYNPEIGAAVPGPLRPRVLTWTLPAMGLAILAANVSLGAVLHSRGRGAAILLSVGAVLAQLAIGVLLLRIGT